MPKTPHVRAFYPCRLCNAGDLVRLSAYDERTQTPLTAWRCTNDRCGFTIRTKAGVFAHADVWPSLPPRGWGL